MSWTFKGGCGTAEKIYGPYKLNAVIAGPEYCLARQYINLKKANIDDAMIKARMKTIEGYYANKFMVFLEVSFQESDPKQPQLNPFNALLCRSNNRISVVANNTLSLEENTALVHKGDKFIPLECTLERTFESSPKNVFTMVFQGNVPAGENLLLVDKLLDINERVEIALSASRTKVVLSNELKREMGIL